ncbi:hypothetical protein GCM10009839_81850 [Catenulispora yoronensis]|uniref:Phosphoglycerate mutase n=1 Tax=Catenulispora yoronensis TaxID=450799 RepID=A0ABN2VCJ7_9ACTN
MAAAPASGVNRRRLRAVLAVRHGQSRTNSEGQTETYTTTETYTQWKRVDGQVEVPFTGLLVPACGPLAEELPAWPLADAVPYERGMAAGRRIVAYDVEPEEGFDDAGVLMGPRIDDAVRQDIGGAKQRITEVRTAYENTRFTLVLLPAWLATYRHGGQSFSLLVNGSSAEVAGEHPVSRGKVVATVAVLLVAAVVGGILMWGH